MDDLSEHDRAVVKTIFDQFQNGSNEGAQETNQNHDNEDTEENLSDDVLNIVKNAISCAEIQNFVECFRLFDEALRRMPESPSVLNDRAQALRLAGRDEEALKDLNLAVKLSSGKSKARIQALCQRGILYRCLNMNYEARKDFELATKGGSDFAQAQLIDLNPYAAMGNEILSEIAKNSGVDERDLRK